MTKKLLLALFACSTLIFSCHNAMDTEEKNTNASQEQDTFIQDLISKMSIEQKAGQMTQLNLDVISVGEIYNLKEPHELDTAKLKKAIIEKHTGSILNVGGHAYNLEHWQTMMKTIQDMATQETELNIPILYGIDAIHGANYLMEGTLFPQPLAQAATFNPDMVETGAAITAYETRATGVPWNFSPVLDLGRQPLWSRFFETYGEDVYLAKAMGNACVNGYQGEDASNPYKVSACLKHFLGYSNSFTGKDRTPVYIHDRQLREYYLPTFKSAIDEGALSIMINSGEMNGIAVHANQAILTDLLRDELGFDGVAVTDWEDIIKLHQFHKVAKDMKEAVKMAVMAGVDMSMTPNDYSFTDYLVELVNEGEVPESRLDESVYRILLMKKRLGLFETPLTYVDNSYELVGSDSFANISQQIAEEAITLLKNEKGLLPLGQNQSVFVTGEAANSLILLNGSWTRTWQGLEEKYDDPNKLSITDAMAEQFTLSQTVGSSSVIIACIAEKPSTEKPGDIDDLTFDQKQIEMVKSLSNYRKPLVLVLVENRPRVISEIEPLCDAIVMAYQPSDNGARAIANIVSGKVNPSGKLPFTYPKHTNALLTYDHKHTEQLATDFSLNAFDPQWEFGTGLSYTNYQYSNLTTSTDTITDTDTLKITVDVMNTGDMDGKETVLLFISDKVASVTPSVKRLRGFGKQFIKAGEKTTYEFNITPNDLKFVGVDLDWIIEEGDFQIQVGKMKQSFYYQP